MEGMDSDVKYEEVEIVPVIGGFTMLKMVEKGFCVRDSDSFLRILFTVLLYSEVF